MQTPPKHTDILHCGTCEFQLKLDILDGALAPQQDCDASLISFPGGSDSQTQPEHHIFAEGKSTKEDRCLPWKVLILFAFAPLRCLD